MLFFIILPLNPCLAGTDADRYFQEGMRLSNQQSYEAAIIEFEKAINLEPNNPKYQHELALSYGHAAERAGWFKAMGLAKNTLKHLKIAAELSPNDVEILDDLMDYYREAPIFLGGDNKKADEIEKLIEKLNQSQFRESYSSSD